MYFLGIYTQVSALNFDVFSYQHEATRSFYMRLEAATEAVKGEQLGVRCGLFNYWNQDLEVRLNTTLYFVCEPITDSLKW